MICPYRCVVRYFYWLLMLSFFSLSANAQSKNTLSYFLETAKANSPVINDYNNQVISNRIDSLKLRATYGFIVSGESNAGYAPNRKGWGYDNVITNGQSFFAGIRVAKEFIGRDNFDARLKSYTATNAQVVSQKNINIQTLNKQITDQYITTYASQQQYNLSQEIIHLLEEEDVVLRKLTQTAVFKQTDYLTFKVTFQQTELRLEQQKADWQNNYAMLNYLSGIVEDTYSLVETPVIADSSGPLSFDESAYAKAFKADSLKLINDAKIIQYDYKPKITAFSDGGYQSSFTLTPYKNFGASVGVALSLPLYDGQRKKMLLEQNQIALQSRQKYQEQTRRQYQQQVNQIQNQIKQYEEIIKTAGEQITYATTLVEANTKQLPTGDVKMVDFILSINNLLSLKGNIIQFQATLFMLRNQLHYLIIP